MARDEGEMLAYDRQDLRKATKFVEGDYTGINPRQFYRSLKRSLEEFQEGNDFKYETQGSQQSDLAIESEDVGEKTGRVTGRLAASSEAHELGKGVLEYRPYGPHGALGIVVGTLFLLVGLAGSTGFALLGLVLVVGGGYAYFQKEDGKFPIEREDFIRTLITGEVSERTIDEDDETRTDIFANMSVIYAGDTLLKVSESELNEMDWTLRRAIVTQVNRWYNELLDEDEDEDEVEVADGFVADLTSWANRSKESDWGVIAKRQHTINATFEKRIEYTEILLDQLPEPVQDSVEQHQDSILDELEELSEDMDIYVEREGLQRV